MSCHKICSHQETSVLKRSSNLHSVLEFPLAIWRIKFGSKKEVRMQMFVHQAVLALYDYLFGTLLRTEIMIIITFNAFKHLILISLTWLSLWFFHTVKFSFHDNMFSLLVLWISISLVISYVFATWLQT